MEHITDNVRDVTNVHKADRKEKYQLRLHRF